MLRRGILALLALVTVASSLAIIAAPVAADHAYSHRYVVVGRVLNNLGEPAMGWTATATLSGATVAGPCSLPPTAAPTTDRSGDFFLCYHVHGFSGGTVTVSGPGFQRSFPLNVDLRRTVVYARLDTTWPTDPTTVAVFHTQYTVRGRVWQAQPGANVEGIPVNGIALLGQAVSIDFTYNGGSKHSGSTTTNNYGDYGSLLSLSSNLTDGSLQVSSAGFRPRPLAVDPEFMVGEADVVLPQAPSPLLEFLVSYYWVLLAGTGVVVAAWFALTRARPRRAARDISRIPGVGRSKAEVLRNAGVGTLDRLAAASPKDLADRTKLSQKEAKRLIRKAKDALEAERGRAASPDED